MNRGRRPSIVVDNRRRSIPAWQDRISDPSLTVLLVLQLCAIFVAAPLAAKGLPMARTVANALVLAVLAIVVMLSRKWGAIVVILLGLAATVASSYRQENGRLFRARSPATAVRSLRSPRWFGW